MKWKLTTIAALALVPSLAMAQQQADTTKRDTTKRDTSSTQKSDTSQWQRSDSSQWQHSDTSHMKRDTSNTHRDTTGAPLATKGSHDGQVLRMRDYGLASEPLKPRKKN